MLQELMEKVEKPELLLLDQARQQILRDIPRTYTTLGFLHDDSHQISKAFESVLLVYARTHPDKGYAQVSTNTFLHPVPHLHQPFYTLF